MSVNDGKGTETMVDGKALRAATSLLSGGFITYVMVTFLHTGGPANHHKAIFDDYAHSHDWAIVHIGQFAGMAVIVAGLLVLHLALNLRATIPMWLGRLGAVFAGVALGLYGVLQAVDGVALKHAVEAWASAPVAEKAARFASAETLRWLEWGTRSYHSYTLGLALILLGLAVALSARLPRTPGYLMGLSGLAYIAQGWTLASEGFSTTNTTAILVGHVITLAWITGLAATAWRMPTIADHSPPHAPIVDANSAI